MTSPRPAPAHADAPRVGDRALARSVTATWWYTVGGIIFFALTSMAQWPLSMLARREDADLGWRLVVVAGAGLMALAGVAVLLRGYRPSVLAQPHDERRHLQRADALGLGLTTVAAVLFGIASGSWLAGISIVALGISVRPWLHGIRWRVLLGLTVVLVGLWIAEAGLWPSPTTDGPLFFVPALFAILLPLICVSSLWWWDVVLELDRARQAESLLAATRERLRLANDVHDLQGHHLQVIALQLELAQRLMPSDPDAAAREITRARTAVDAARQGTRDLAAQFRGVPLPDELDNAADLLRSAGLDVDARVCADVAGAPADVLGPIVRESVTNVLKHGDGTWARLSLEHSAERWVYSISNDDTVAEEAGWGTGLDGMTERAKAVGGDVKVRRGSGSFELTVSLPAGRSA